MRAFGVPLDASLAVRDEFTWRVAGPAGGDAPNIVSVDEAERWTARGASAPWPTREPFQRVIDPRWSHATWLDVDELTRLLDRYEKVAGQPAPATYCALLAMMRELERDFVVRLILWLERRHPAALAPSELHALPARDHPAELERARTHVRHRRRRTTNSVGETR